MYPELSDEQVTRVCEALRQPDYHGRQEAYLGTTVWLPPGVPGGGITGIVPWLFGGSGAWMPGSTVGGCNVPSCCDSRSLRLPLPTVPANPHLERSAPGAAGTRWAARRWDVAGSAAPAVGSAHRQRMARQACHKAEQAAEIACHGSSVIGEWSYSMPHRRHRPIGRKRTAVAGVPVDQRPLMRARVAWLAGLSPC